MNIKIKTKKYIYYSPKLNKLRLADVHKFAPESWLFITDFSGRFIFERFYLIGEFK